MSKVKTNTATRTKTPNSDAVYVPGNIRVNSETRAEGDTYTFEISNAGEDRHGSVIPISAWRLDNYNKNGIVAYLHKTNDYRANPDLVIGKGQAYIDGDRLMADTIFEPQEINELAHKIRSKIDFGSLRAVSVGFLPIKWHWGNREQNSEENDDVLYFDEVELLEFSVVDIPSNPDAGLRSLDGFLRDERDIRTDKKESSEENDKGDKHKKVNMRMNENLVRLNKNKRLAYGLRLIDSDSH